MSRCDRRESDARYASKQNLAKEPGAVQEVQSGAGCRVLGKRAKALLGIIVLESEEELRVDLLPLSTC